MLKTYKNVQNVQNASKYFRATSRRPCFYRAAAAATAAAAAAAAAVAALVMHDQTRDAPSVVRAIEPATSAQITLVRKWVLELQRHSLVKGTFATGLMMHVVKFTHSRYTAKCHL